MREMKQKSILMSHLLTVYNMVSFNLIYTRK